MSQEPGVWRRACNFVVEKTEGIAPCSVRGNVRLTTVRALRNIQKHGVAFEEAETVFDDPLPLDKADPASPTNVS